MIIELHSTVGSKPLARSYLLVYLTLASTVIGGNAIHEKCPPRSLRNALLRLSLVSQI